MRIGLDARSIGERVCGVSRVTRCLIEALSRVDTENEYVVYTEEVVSRLTIGKNFQLVRTRCSRMNPLLDLKFSLIMRKDNIDLYHCMHSWLPWFVPQSVKTIVTVSDLFAVNDPDFFKRYTPFDSLIQSYFARITDRSVRKADAIITISNYSRREIVKEYPFCDNKIAVVYCAAGIGGENVYCNNGKRLIHGRYLLYVGNCRSYKNVGTMVRGYGIFIEANRGTGVQLVIAGNDDYGEIMETTKRLNLDRHVTFLTNPSDGEIANLYFHAYAFVFPSKYEGFGIPVLEAMQFGVPVIISDADALTEVAGEAAIVFNRNNPSELASLIERVIGDKELRQSLIQKGYERTKHFSWELSAAKLRNIYRNIAGKEN